MVVADKGGGRPFAALALLAIAALLFATLGGWQLRRRAWKEALIERVAQRVAAPPLTLAELPAATGPVPEYRRLTLAGRYDPGSATLVGAATELGSGYWDMAVLRAGPEAIWVNRGFVPLGSRRKWAAMTTPRGMVTVTGLIRPTEPLGTWLRANQPAADRWYARDVAAMARARRVMGARPDMFVDAQNEQPDAGTGAPVPGLTVLTFPNNHLAYAITWFGLALLCVAAAPVLWRRSP